MSVAGVPVVVRASDLAAVARLEERFAAHRCAHPGAEARVSLAVSTAEHGRRTTNAVHRDGWSVRTTHDLDSALDTVERVLCTFAPRPAGIGAVHARVLERDGRALLVSDTFREALDGHHRRIAAAGFVDGLASPAWVDPVRAEVLLPEGTLARPTWRRVPVDAVVAFAPAEDVDSPAVRVTHFTALVVGRGRPTTAADVRVLVELLARVPFRRLDVTEHREVAAAVVASAAVGAAADPQSALSAARTSSS